MEGEKLFDLGDCSKLEEAPFDNQVYLPIKSEICVKENPQMFSMWFNLREELVFIFTETVNRFKWAK